MQNSRIRLFASRFRSSPFSLSARVSCRCFGALCPRHRSLQRFRATASPSLHGVPDEAGSPASSVLLDAPNPVQPSLSASFPSQSRYHRHPSFAPARIGRPSRSGQGCSPASPTGFLSWSPTGLPGSLENLCVHALLFDPGGSDGPAHVAFGASLLPSARFKASAPTWRLARLNHTACTLAVYASQPGLPLHHARLASGWGPAFPGRASRPQGSFVRFPLFSYMASSSPRLLLAHGFCLSVPSLPRRAYAMHTRRFPVGATREQDLGTSRA